MWKDNPVFYKSKSYLNVLFKYWRSQKKPSRLSTNLNNPVYFDRWDHSNPSMGSSDTLVR